MKSIDIRSESAIKLLAEFLDMDTPYIEGERHLNAEHFAHEIYSYLRSPYRDLNTYDSLAQYDISSDLPLPYRPERTDRWQQPSASRSLSSESPSRRSRIRSLSRPRSSVSLRENTRSRSPVEVHGAAERSLPKRGRHNRSPIRSRELSDSIHEDDPRPRRNRRNDGDEHDDNSYRTRVTKGKGKQKEQVVVLLRDSNVQRRSPVPDSTAQIRVDTPTIGNLSKDIKGKQKAEELCPSDTPFTGSSVCGTPAAATQRLDNAVPLETYSAMQTAEGNSGTGFGASRSRKPTTGNTRPPRNRTLLESVQAHLAGPSSTSKRVNPIGKITAVGQADNEHSDIIAHLATSDSRAPSMLLTNSPSLKTPSPHPNYQSFITPAVQISDISRRARRPMPLDEEGNVTDIRKFSAPEIMARARHKLSISKDDRLPGAALPASCPTVDRSDEPPSIPPIQNHIPPSPNFNAETKAGSDRRGNQESATDNKTNTSDVVSSDTRSMLLEKLKAEQKPAQNTVPHPRFSRSSPSYQATPLVFHTDNGTQHASSPNINEGDASELETKLRARLTAIKRKVNDSPLDHNNNSSSGKGGGISFNGDAESSNREESLRARLRKRLD
ncbi:hypothetical protein BJ138DRAFT_482883 [Hygrophoropsis aurantiaca]|uniref:Uncharacterized protein n=1 Tax=Hygrophoropsis aurantiaca TaxID=72124 RepID=A0ACB8A4A3_9AGAM|nr:hypothetical protein BJ138DRAFT_482883 [Hygrophoropsis aurantiaca]